MAGSSSYVPSNIGGMALRAWALVSSSGTLLKGSNVSAAVRNSAGNFTLTLATNMADTNVMFDLRSTATNAGGVPVLYIGALSVGGVSYQTFIAGTPTDPSLSHYVAIYG